MERESREERKRSKQWERRRGKGESKREGREERGSTSIFVVIKERTLKDELVLSMLKSDKDFFVTVGIEGNLGNNLNFKDKVIKEEGGELDKLGEQHIT